MLHCSCVKESSVDTGVETTSMVVVEGSSFDLVSISDILLLTVSVKEGLGITDVDIWFVLDVSCELEVNRESLTLSVTNDSVTTCVVSDISENDIRLVESDGVDAKLDEKVVVDSEL